MPNRILDACNELYFIFMNSFLGGNCAFVCSVGKRSAVADPKTSKTLYRKNVVLDVWYIGNRRQFLPYIPPTLRCTQNILYGTLPKIYLDRHDSSSLQEKKNVRIFYSFLSNTLG